MYLLNLSKTQWRQKRDNVKEKYKEIKRRRLEALKKKKQEDLVKRKDKSYKKGEKQTSDMICI